MKVAQDLHSDWLKKIASFYSKKKRFLYYESDFNYFESKEKEKQIYFFVKYALIDCGCE